MTEAVLSTLLAAAVFVLGCWVGIFSYPNSNWDWVGFGLGLVIGGLLIEYGPPLWRRLRSRGT